MAKSNAALAAMMREHRPAADIDRDVKTTFLGQMAQESEAATMIPLTSIVDSPFQRRAPLNDEALDNLAKSITEHGIITPIIVREIDGGQFELITGHRRTAACRKIGRATIPAVVRVMSDHAAAIAVTSDNGQHAGLTDWERYKHLAMLLDGKHVRNVADAGEVVGVAKASAYNLKAFGDLPEPVHAMLDANPTMIGGTVAYALRKVAVSHPDLVTQAASLIRDEKINQSAALQWIEKQIAPRAARISPARYERSFSLSDNAIRIVAVGDDVKVTGDIDVEKLMQLIETNLGSILKSQDPDS